MIGIIGSEWVVSSDGDGGGGGGNDCDVMVDADPP
jgi:hypothetical protein